MPQQPGGLEHGGVLHRGRTPVVQGLDPGPELAHREHLARDGVGAGDGRGFGTGIILRTHREHRTHAIDEAVGDRRRDDFAAQPVALDAAGEAPLHRAREVARELPRQIAVFGYVRQDERLVQPDLAVTQSDRELRTGQAFAGFAPLGDVLLRREKFERPIQVPGTLERAYDVGALAQTRLGSEFAGADRLALQVIVAQYQGGHCAGHLHEQTVARRARDLLRGDGAVQQDFQVDLDVRAVHPRRIVDGVRVETPAAPCILDAAELGQSEIAAFADHLAVQLARVDAQRVVGAVADIGVAFGARLHVSADAAVPHEIDMRPQDRLDDLVGRGHPRQLEQVLRLARQGETLGAARKHAAALGNRSLRIILPGRPRQLEQALPFFERARRIGRGVDEDMLVIEGGDQPDMRGLQHAVAEDVARHVADAGDGKVLPLHVDSHFAKMALDAFPCAAGGDRHFLVVITRRAAGGEGIPQPEAVFRGECVGDIGERGGALVGGDDEVGIVAVVAHHERRPDDLVADDVVSDVEHAANEGSIAGDDLGRLGFASADEGALHDEAALGAHRHDDGVLHLLGLHAPEDFGPEILAPIGPADSAARHEPHP